MLSSCEPLHLDTLAPPVHRAAQWRAEVTAGLALSFDEWLAARLSAGENGSRRGSSNSEEFSIRYRQGPVVFELVHGASYAVGLPSKPPRYFHCLLDGTYPYISFYRPGLGTGFPWITLARIFIANELRSLRRVSAAHIFTGNM